MRKNIIVKKLNLEGGNKLNKTELARQFGCCWRTINRRINPEKYKCEKKKRIYSSKLDNFKTIIDEKIENNNVPATGIYPFTVSNRIVKFLIISFLWEETYLFTIPYLPSKLYFVFNKNGKKNKIT